METTGLCDLCGMGWCGRPCFRDAKKRNGLLFHADGRAKTLKERGLAWDSPPLIQTAPNPKRRAITPHLKLLLGKKGVAKDVPKVGADVSKVPNVSKVEKPVSKVEERKMGRPASGLSPAERKRRQREAKKGKPLDFKG
jgi:hypothetical protein